MDRWWKMGALLSLALIGSVLGCGERDPGAEVADPRAHIIEQIQTMDLRIWWQPYRDPDPEKIGALVDAAAAKDKDGLPRHLNDLDHFLHKWIYSRYKSMIEDSDEGKAYILARAEERFADPPSTVWDKKKRFALLDYHVLPGTWGSTTRLSEGLKFPPALGTSPFLKPEIVARSLKLLRERHPEAAVYQIRYGFHAGSSLRTITMQIVPDSWIVYRDGVYLPFTQDRVPFQDLLDARVDLGTLNWDQEMEGYEAPTFSSPPKEPLPSRP